MRKAFLLGFLGLAMMVHGVYRAEAGNPPAAKIGFVDLQRTLNETKAGKKARAGLEAMKKKKQAEIDKKQEDLKKYAEELDKQRVVLKPEVLRQREKELQDKYVELQNLFLQYQQELAKKEAELTREIFSAAAKHIEAIARRDGYTMMLEKTESAVLWADKAADITDEVNKKLDAEK